MLMINSPAIRDGSIRGKKEEGRAREKSEKKRDGRWRAARAPKDETSLLQGGRGGKKLVAHTNDKHSQRDKVDLLGIARRCPATVGIGP